MADVEKVISGLDCRANDSKLDCKECAYYIRTDEPAYCDFRKMLRDAIALLKEQEHKDKMFHALEKDWKRLKKQKAVEPEPGEWIYCEDVSGQDGYKCSECGFFEPWYYGFENHSFITDYAYCPSCGKSMQEHLIENCERKKGEQNERSS